MNGIIHPCSHLKQGGIPNPVTYDDIFVNAFHYIDRLVDIVRQKELIYMAIDGVAPRAKLNQQRSRIFRAALEAVRIQKEKGDKEIIGEHKGLNSDSLNTYIEKNFNSNQIIPGTEFMQKLKIAQQYNIYDRKNDLTKIASNNRILYLETFQQSLMIQISLEYGADADLIVLGLSTHEPYFYIIRETIIANDDIQCSI